MRAVRLRSRGSPPRLSVDHDVADPPAPTGTQLLVRVGASSVNGTDVGLARGGLPVARVRRTPLVLGFDVAGEVVACGPRVTGFDVGDRVMALLGHGGGGQADLALVPQARAARAPSTVPVEQAGALPLAALTALQALRDRAQLRARRSPRVLVVGAAGGIGSYAVQLAALDGARVTALGSGPRTEYLRSLGAEEVLDRRAHDVLTSGERWDVVLDAPAALTFEAVRPLLTPDGVMVSTHPISPDSLRSLAVRPLRRGGPRFASVMTRSNSFDLAHLAHLVDAGALRVPLDRTFALDDVAQAHRHVSGGGLQGKVAILV